MPETITLITCTGGREEAFRLCERYMKRQTVWDSDKYKIQWIVIDDCVPATLGTLNQEYYRGTQMWKEGINTQRPNMEQAFRYIKGDYILTIEDDDWYHPLYIENMVTLLQQFDIVGEGNAKYYSIKVPGFKEMGNYKHTSLCQLGIRKSVLPIFETAISGGHLYMDIDLWQKANDHHLKSCIFANENLCVGIKGMPGRDGIGVGHRQRDYMYDHGLLKLQEWIGSDVELYKPFIGKQR